MASCSLGLIDGDTGRMFNLLLSSDDFKIDMPFATKLLELAKAKEGNSLNNLDKYEDWNEMDDFSDVSCNDETFGDENMQPLVGKKYDSSEDTSYSWSHSATVCFIDCYQRLEGKVSSGKCTFKTLWEKIAKEMHAQGYNMTAGKCSSEMTSLKKSYKNVRDHNAKSGNDRKEWKYYDLLDNIFCKKPWAAPLATISSTSTEINTFETNSTTCSPSGPKKKLRKSVEDYLEKSLSVKEGSKKSREDQHEEKMQRLDKMNSLLECLVANTEKQ